MPINTLRHAYDLIAPEELASMYEASFAQSMVNSLNLQHRMDDIRWGSTGFCADGFVIQDNHGYTKNDGKSVADKNPAVEETAPPSSAGAALSPAPVNSPRWVRKAKTIQALLGINSTRLVSPWVWITG